MYLSKSDTCNWLIIAQSSRHKGQFTPRSHTPLLNAHRTLAKIFIQAHLHSQCLKTAMYSTIAINILALAAAVRGFTIPVGTPDGVYEQTTDGAGKEWHRQIGNITHMSSDFTASVKALGTLGHRFRFSRREIKPNSKSLPNGVTCAPSGAILQEQDVTTASFSLATTCDKTGSEFVPHNGARYAVSGNAAVYVCNMAGTDHGCSSASVYNYIPAVSEQCTQASGEASKLVSWHENPANVNVLLYRMVSRQGCISLLRIRSGWGHHLQPQRVKLSLELNV